MVDLLVSRVAVLGRVRHGLMAPCDRAPDLTRVRGARRRVWSTAIEVVARGW